MTAPKSALAALRVAALAALARALSAAVWLVIFAFGGIGLLLAGIYLLGGLPWALVAAGAIALVLAGLLLTGMNRA